MHCINWSIMVDKLYNWSIFFMQCWSQTFIRVSATLIMTTAHNVRNVTMHTVVHVIADGHKHNYSIMRSHTSRQNHSLLRVADNKSF